MSINLSFVKNTIQDKYNDLEWDDQGNCIKHEYVGKVMLWKFIDENGNLWNTETAIDGTEEEAASIILGNNQ
jgi:hypothetical protein